MFAFVDKTVKNYDTVVDKFINKLIEEERSSYNSKLKDFNTYSQEIKEQTSKKLTDFKESFLRGYGYILENGPKCIPSVPKEKFVLNPVQKEKHKKMTERHLAKILRASKPLQEICGYTTEMMTGIYQMGVDLYRSKDFKTCTDICTFLVTFNPFICWFWHMLGRCYEQQNAHLEALYAFEVAINCNVHQFDCYAAAVGCCIHAKEFGEAHRIIDYGINVVNTSDHPQEFEQLRVSLVKLQKEVDRIAKGG